MTLPRRPTSPMTPCPVNCSGTMISGYTATRVTPACGSTWTKRMMPRTLDAMLSPSAVLSKKMENKTLLLAFEKATPASEPRWSACLMSSKNFFGYRKVRYKRLVKNHVQLFSLANLVLVIRCEVRINGASAP